MKNIKKITLGVLGTAILASGLWACNNDESNDNQTELINKESAETLILKLNNYNSKFNYSNTERNQTYGWGEKFLDIVTIGAADGVGAAAGAGAVQVGAAAIGLATAGTGYAVVSTIGAVAGGASGSRLAYCTLYPKNCRGTKSINGHFDAGQGYGSSIKFDLSEPFKYIENFGILHNNLLEYVYTEDYTDQAEIEWFENNIENIDQVDYNMFYNSPVYKTAVKEIEAISRSYVEKDFSTEYLLDSYVDLGFLSKNVRDILEVYQNTILKTNNFDDISEITQYYVHEVSNSNLSKNEKECLFSAFSVNIQSIYYWSNFASN